jgi:short subunit dehydrogenase-like uncharacterized protein
MAKTGIVVYGANGHTGAFVVAELYRRGWAPVLAGRDAGKLEALAVAYPGSEIRVANVHDGGALDAVLRGARAVVNCAGPFLETAGPVIDAALRARVHYLDVTAEQPAALAAFRRGAGIAGNAGVAVIPALAFYGGLGDLLVTAATTGWPEVDEIRIGVALDSWRPTLGTRLTGQRNVARRLVVSRGTLQVVPDPPPTSVWDFPPPFGAQEMVAVPMSEIITIWRHLRAGEIATFMNLAPLRDLRNPDTPPPVAADSSGRSAQTFVMEVVVRHGTQARCASARGRDIYATTAPLVCEAVERLLDGRSTKRDACAAGELFDAADFLHALRSEHLEIRLPG